MQWWILTTAVIISLIKNFIELELFIFWQLTATVIVTEIVDEFIYGLEIMTQYGFIVDNKERVKGP